MITTLETFSPAQRRIVDALEAWEASSPDAPSVREIARAAGQSHPNARRILAQLEQLGAIRIDRGNGRNGRWRIRALAYPSGRPTRAGLAARPLRVPIRIEGEIAAGAPVEAIESHQVVDLPNLRIAAPGHYYLRVRGRSMSRTGILDGDVVLVRRQPSIDPGDIAACLLPDGTTTLKRVVQASDVIRLVPDADGFEPIEVESVEIQGKVVGLFRDYD